jgi:hypothetical protein
LPATQQEAPLSRRSFLEAQAVVVDEVTCFNNSDGLRVLTTTNNDGVGCAETYFFARRLAPRVVCAWLCCVVCVVVCGCCVCCVVVCCVVVCSVVSRDMFRQP